MKATVYKIQRGIDRLFRYIGGIPGVDQVEHKAVSPPGNQVFRVVCRHRAERGVCDRQAVVWIPAGMHHAPRIMGLHHNLIILLRPDV